MTIKKLKLLLETLLVPGDAKVVIKVPRVSPLYQDPYTSEESIKSIQYNSHRNVVEIEIK